MQASSTPIARSSSSAPRRRLLSQLTQFAGVVMTPRRREASFRHLEFLRLSERRVLLIIVTPEGDVQNRILHTDRAYTQSQLIEASNFFNAHFAGQPFRDHPRCASADELRALREDIAQPDDRRRRRRRGRAERQGEALVVSGERNLLNTRGSRVEHGAAAPAVRDLRAEDVAAAPARPVAARAGRAASSSAANPGSCRSTNAASSRRRTKSNGQVIGTLGVIGPTRMAYERVIPIVDITAKLLSNALTQQIVRTE